MFFDFSNHANARVQILLPKTRFLNTAPDPPDPAEMEHKLRLATYRHRAGGQDDVSLNKLPQMIDDRR